MTSPVSPSLPALRQLLNEASATPWACNDEPTEWQPTEGHVWSVPIRGMEGFSDEVADVSVHGDAALIVAAVNALPQLIDELEDTRLSHQLMAKQFRTMQAEKEHGWREAERWEERAEAKDALIASQAAAIEAVRALHKPAHPTGPTSCVECNQGRKFVAWPCATAVALSTSGITPTTEETP